MLYSTLSVWGCPDYDPTGCQSTRIWIWASAVASRSQPLGFSRKLPRQRRSQATVDAIFGATARILKSQGLKALNTNSIAEAAGISVGSLYEYFPNKDAILVEMACRILRADEAHVTEVLKSSGESSPRDSIRLLIHTLLELHRTEPGIRRVVMGAHGSAGLRGEHIKTIERISLLYAETSASGSLPLIPPERLYVAIRAILGVMRAALEEKSVFLDSPVLETELVRTAFLIMGIEP